jgi:hypothetical protein
MLYAYANKGKKQFQSSAAFLSNLQGYIGLKTSQVFWKQAY